MKGDFTAIKVNSREEVYLVLDILYKLGYVWQASKCQVFVPSMPVSYITVRRRSKTIGYIPFKDAAFVRQCDKIPLFEFLASNGKDIKEVIRKKLDPIKIIQYG